MEPLFFQLQAVRIWGKEKLLGKFKANSQKALQSSFLSQRMEEVWEKGTSQQVAGCQPPGPP
jgi:hypothetical protein